MSEFSARNLARAPEAVVRREQEGLLRRHVAYCLRRSPFYRRTLAGSALPRRLALEDLPLLPLTDKDQLAAENAAFVAAPPGRIADIVQSSGTTGSPTAVAYTERDLRRLAYNERRAFSLCGVRRGDVALLTCTMDRCFVAGLAYYLGLREAGAAVIRSGNAPLESQADLIRRLRPAVIVGVPSFLRRLGQNMAASGLKPEAAGVRALVCIGEPLRDRDLAPLKLDRDLTALWHANAYSTYASTETITTFCECSERQGGHWSAELALVEILDEQGRAQAPGAPGEVVVTPLQIEGMPLLRFRTGDISFLMDKPCRCGRTGPRLGPILGRKSQMLKIRGTTVYPPALSAAMDEIRGVREYYVRVTSDDALSDIVEIHVCTDGAAETAGAMAARIQARTRVKPRIVVEPAEAVLRVVHNPASRKPIRFVDERRAGPEERRP